jgi:hypothetical protein
MKSGSILFWPRPERERLAEENQVADNVVYRTWSDRA